MTNATHPQTDYLSVAEVAHLLGLSRMTVYRMCQQGDFEYIRTGRAGRTYRITRSSFEQHTRPVQTPAPSRIPGQTEIEA